MLAKLIGIAATARTDAARAETIQHALDVLSNHDDSSLVKPGVEFIGASRGYIAGEEVAATIKFMWPTIRENTISGLREELRRIEQKYAPLLEKSDA